MTSLPSGTAPTFTSFMARLQERQTPALLWYSAPGERIELSGRVLDNWVSKSANFLVDECEVDAGAQVALTRQVHWRSVVLLLAALRTGAALSFGQGAEGGQVQLAFSAEEIAGSGAEYPVLLDRGPLSMRFMGQLPAGVTDYCAEVRSHSDVYGGFALPTSGDFAFEGVTYGELMDRAVARADQLSAQQAESRRALILEPSALSPAFAVDLLGTLLAGYGALLLDPAETWEPERLERIAADERAATIGAP